MFGNFGDIKLDNRHASQSSSSFSHWASLWILHVFSELRVLSRKPSLLWYPMVPQCSNESHQHNDISVETMATESINVLSLFRCPAYPHRRSIQPAAVIYSKLNDNNILLRHTHTNTHTHTHTHTHAHTPHLICYSVWENEKEIH